MPNGISVKVVNIVLVIGKKKKKKKKKNHTVGTIPKLKYIWLIDGWVSILNDSFMTCMMSMLLIL